MRYLPRLSLLLLVLSAQPGIVPEAFTAELKTRHATLIYTGEEQLRRLDLQLRLGGRGFSFGNSSSATMDNRIKEKIDRICGRVQEILAMKPAALSFQIQLLPTRKEVQEIYQQQYQRRVDYIAFYSPRSETVYFSVKDLRLPVFAHEIAHAVIDRYFDKPPPVKIHELLAQYVEKQL